MDILYIAYNTVQDSWGYVRVDGIRTRVCKDALYDLSLGSLFFAQRSGNICRMSSAKLRMIFFVRYSEREIFRVDSLFG